MKKAIAKILSYTLYYIGNSTTYLLYTEYGSFAYPIYSWFMIKSCQIQDWAGLDLPWEKSEKNI
jgi:hypothetical protein